MSNGDGKKGKKDLHREAYGAAMSRLRQAHPEEFNTLRQEEAKNRGLDWKPKPTEQEKARAQLAEILTAHPELMSELAQVENQPAPSFPDPAHGGGA